MLLFNYEKFLFILISRFVDYEPANKKEKGAESADKSWYGVARKVAENYGYNKGRYNRH